MKYYFFFKVQVLLKLFLTEHNAAAAAAKSLQSCLTLCDPTDGGPTTLPRPWDSPGKNTGVGCHFVLQCMKVKSESEVAQSCPTPWTAAHQAPLSMGFSRQEYSSGVPLPSPTNLLRASKSHLKCSPESLHLTRELICSLPSKMIQFI